MALMFKCWPKLFSASGPLAKVRQAKVPLLFLILTDYEYGILTFAACNLYNRVN
jgi:hypothetical protein